MPDGPGSLVLLIGLGKDLHVDTGKVAIGDCNPSFLMDLIERQVGFKPEFAMDSNMPDEAKSDLLVGYLDYYRQNVFYLPFPFPEEAIWDNGGCRKLLDVADPNTSKKRAAEIEMIADHKKRFASLSEALAMDIDATHTIFVKRLSNTEGEQWTRLVELITWIGDIHG